MLETGVSEEERHRPQLDPYPGESPTGPRGCQGPGDGPWRWPSDGKVYARAKRQRDPLGKKELKPGSRLPDEMYYSELM